MRYLVCRLDALRPNGYMRTSEFFPMIVEYNPHPGEACAETVVRKALDSINRGYVGMYQYIVTPLDRALVVDFKPRQSYNVEVHKYLSCE